jgi:hypothetical protein
MTHDELAMPIAVVWCNLNALLITLMSLQVLPLVPDSTVRILRFCFELLSNQRLSGPDPGLGPTNKLMSSPHDAATSAGDPL